MSPLDDVYAEAYGKALEAYLRASGGQAEIHASIFGIATGDYNRALHRLATAGRAEPLGGCVWRLVRCSTAPARDWS